MSKDPGAKFFYMWKIFDIWKYLDTWTKSNDMTKNFENWKTIEMWLCRHVQKKKTCAKKSTRRKNLSCEKFSTCEKVFDIGKMINLWGMCDILRVLETKKGTCMSPTREAQQLPMRLCSSKDKRRLHVRNTHDAKVALLSPTCINIIPAGLSNTINLEIDVYV